MIAGLGNWHITADSLGPKVIDKIVVTRHVKNNGKCGNRRKARQRMRRIAGRYGDYRN